MYYFNLCILDINTRSFSTVALVPATVVVICSYLQIYSDCCNSRKKLEMFFRKEGLYELTCCSPRDISAEYLCWKECSGEGPGCWTSLCLQPTPVKEEMSSLRDCRVPLSLGSLFELHIGSSDQSVAGRKRCFSWGCQFCNWVALRYQPGHHHGHGFMSCISRGRLFWGVKPAGQIEKDLYFSVLF